MNNPEDLTPPSVADMLRVTGENTSNFMFYVSEHIEKLEQEVVRLQSRIVELESKQNEPKRKRTKAV
jgi:hypothetical protein